MAEANDVNSRKIDVIESVLIRPADDQLSIAQNDSLVNYSDDSIENAISEIVHHKENDKKEKANDASSEFKTSEVLIISSNESRHMHMPTTGEAEADVTKKIALQQLESISRKSPGNLSSTNDILSSNGSQKKNILIIEKDDLEKKLIGAGVAVEDKPTKRILNRNAPCPNRNIDEDDLIAILQGTDILKKEEVTIEGEGQFEVFDVIDTDKESSPEKEEKENPKEKIPKPIPRNRRRKQDISKMLVTDLVTSLASEWSDADEEHSDSKGEIKIKKSPSKLSSSTVTLTSPINITSSDDSSKQPITEGIQSEQGSSIAQPYKRTRIIKRKIIWDPDAPETQFSYASLLKSPNNPSAIKKENDKKKGRSTPIPNKSEDLVDPLSGLSVVIADNKNTKRKVETPTTVAIAVTKKKKSEIDKLLGDEGAVNMLNSLDPDRNKLDKETKAMGKRERTISPQTKVTPTSTTKKRITKPRAASGWDYVYNQRDDDAMIIRRRSNSSYSSSSPRRLSIDAVQPETLNISNTSEVFGKEKNFEFAKPENKTNKKINKIDSLCSSSLAADIKKGATRKSSRAGPQITEVSLKVNENNNSRDLLIVKKLGSVTQLILHSKSLKANYAFTPQLMNEITTNLKTLLNDVDCKVVVLTTAGQHFCHGVDLKNLTVGTSEKRKAYAQELAKSVRNFLYTLINFTKPIVAGVVGTNFGLGVTMLPLFDVVLGSDKCLFGTPYGDLGYMAEGYSVLCLTKNVRHNFKTKMLWLTEKINATESVLSGLITKLTGTNKVCDETLSVAKKIASLSIEAYQTMKSQRLKYEWSEMGLWLDDEEEILATQWSSSECQERIKKSL